MDCVIELNMTEVEVRPKSIITHKKYEEKLKMARILTMGLELDGGDLSKVEKVVEQMLKVSDSAELGFGELQGDEIVKKESQILDNYKLLKDYFYKKYNIEIRTEIPENEKIIVGLDDKPEVYSKKFKLIFREKN